MTDYVETYRKRTPQSEALFKRAREVMPGAISHSIHYFPPYPFYLKEAQGPRVRDVDGNEYVDLWMGHYTHILGHRPTEVVEAIERQLGQGLHWGIVFEQQIEWAELVREMIPGAEMVRFNCSGTEATMYAVRTARAYTGKNVVLKIAGGWHGANSDLSVGIKMPYDKSESLGLLPGLDQYTQAIPFNDIPGTLEVIERNRKDWACVILEPVIGEGGFLPADRDYLRMLRAETEKAGALLIFDEVISGFRVSAGGAQKAFGITPDMTTLGKILGGGLPVGAIAGKKEILDRTSPERKLPKSERIMIGGGTFSSHPLTVAAGTAMLRYLKDHAAEVYPLLAAKGKKAREGVEQAMKAEGVDVFVSGIGSLYQTHFPTEKGKILNSPQAINRFTDTDRRENEFRMRMMNHGVHVMHGGGALSITHTDEDIDRIIEAARRAAREMKNGK